MGIISLVSSKKGKLYLRLVIALAVIVAAAYAYAATANPEAGLTGSDGAEIAILNPSTHVKDEWLGLPADEAATGQFFGYAASGGDAL